MPEVEMRMQNSYHLDELADVATDVLRAAKEERIWLIDGEMGVGKTTLLKAVAQKLGVTNTVSSPTFSIVNEYKDRLGNSIYHFDFYRLKTEAEAFDIGVHEYLDSGSRCWVEWGEKIPSLLPDRFFKIKLEFNNLQTRTINYVREEENRL